MPMSRLSHALPRLATVAASVVVASALTAPLAAQAADARPTVAILFFNNGSFGPGAKDYDMLGRGIADFLTSDLSANPRIRVVERDRIAQITAEQDMGKSGRMDPETMARVGRMLGAQFMVTGGYIADPKGRVVLTARVFEVETSRILPETQRVEDKADNVVPMIGELAQKLNAGMKLPDLPKRPAPAPGAGGTGAAGAAAPAAEAARPPLSAINLYSKALAAKDRGDKNEAVTLFKASLEKFPEFTKAKAELKALGG